METGSLLHSLMQAIFPSHLISTARFFHFTIIEQKKHLIHPGKNITECSANISTLVSVPIPGHTTRGFSSLKALKCKTLGGIIGLTFNSSYVHTQHTLYSITNVVYILRMRVRVPRCPPSTPVYYISLFHAGCTSS